MDIIGRFSKLEIQLFRFLSLNYLFIKINDKYQNVEAVKIETIIHQFLKEHDGKHIINEWFELSEDMVVKIAECLIKSFE